MVTVFFHIQLFLSLLTFTNDNTSRINYFTVTIFWPIRASAFFYASISDNKLFYIWTSNISADTGNLWVSLKIFDNILNKLARVLSRSKTIYDNP